MLNERERRFLAKCVDIKIREVLRVANARGDLNIGEYTGLDILKKKLQVE